MEGLDNNCNDTGPESSSAERQRPKPPLLSRDNGFVSLAVGEYITIQVGFRPEHELIRAEERYRFCFRGTGIKWWRFGTVEELEAGGGVRKEDGEMEDGRLNSSIIVPCSNLVGFLVGGKG